MMHGLGHLRVQPRKQMPGVTPQQPHSARHRNQAAQADAGRYWRSPAQQAGKRTEMLRSWGRPPSGMWSRQPTTSPCKAHSSTAWFLSKPTACAMLCVKPPPTSRRQCPAVQRSMRHAMRHARGSVMQTSASKKGHMSVGTANHFAAV